MLRNVVAIRGESRCYNKNRKIRIRKSPGGNPRAFCFLRMRNYFLPSTEMTSAKEAFAAQFSVTGECESIFHFSVALVGISTAGAAG